MSRRALSALALALLALLATTRPVRAQDEDPHYARALAPAWGSLAVLVTRARGDIAEVSGTGIGIEAASVRAFTSHGGFRMRSELHLIYDLTHTVPVPPSQLAAGDQVSLGTSASTFNLLIGPELGARAGGTGLYVSGLVGFGSLWQRNHLTGTEAGGATPVDLQVSRNSNVFAWSAGGGVRLRVGRGVEMDLGADYRANVGVRVMQPTDVSTTSGHLAYGYTSADAEQLLFRVGVVRQSR